MSTRPAGQRDARWRGGATQKALMPHGRVAETGAANSVTHTNKEENMVIPNREGKVIRTLTALGQRLGWERLTQLLHEAKRRAQPWSSMCQPECVNALRSYNFGGQYWLCDRHFPMNFWDSCAVEAAVSYLGQPATVPLIDGSTRKVEPIAHRKAVV